MQAAVVCNTQALVQRNIATGAMRMSQPPTAGRAIFSPCGRRMAWTDKNTFTIWDRSAKRQIWSHTLPCNNMHGLSWSSNSSCLAVNCGKGVFLLELVSGLLTHFESGTRPVIGKCRWAPSAQSAAILQRVSDHHSLLSVFQTPSAELVLVQQLQCPRAWHVEWAPDSRMLATVGHAHLGILDTDLQGLVEVAVRGDSGCIVAWSPSCWDTPHLLSVTCSGGEAQFHDHLARLKGDCGCCAPLQGRPAKHLVWGKHGVVFLTDCGLWVFTVGSTPTGFTLDCMHQVTSGLRAPTLSPDHLHLCAVQHRLGGETIERRDDLVLLNIVSGRSTLVTTLPDQANLALEYPAADPSWTSNGFSVAVVLGLNEIDRLRGPQSYCYQMVRFVF